MLVNPNNSLVNMRGMFHKIDTFELYRFSPLSLDKTLLSGYFNEYLYAVFLRKPFVIFIAFNVCKSNNWYVSSYKMNDRMKAFATYVIALNTLFPIHRIHVVFITKCILLLSLPEIFKKWLILFPKDCLQK